ncbi:MAG: P1 family peptidase [Planctomycetes bacterium]|nr:P1 family peptidase [Planctomycetota bacterium]
MSRRPSIVDVEGLSVGHVTDALSGTGCTVFLFESPGARLALDIRGSAAETRSAEPALGFHVVERVPALLFAGGSSFGLAATGGVQAYLEERGLGFDVGVARVPVVPTAILFDLTFRRADRRPDEAMGYAACLAASREPPGEGSVGAGTGATVGKIAGPGRAMKSGFGTAAREGPGGVRVGAAAAVNAFGDVRAWPGGKILAGARGPDGSFLDTMAAMTGSARPASFSPVNTTLVLVATGADLSREELGKLAATAHDGLARTIVPCHTTVDGDLVFAASLGAVRAPLDLLCALAQEAVAEAVVRAVLAADGFGELPGARDGGH